MKKILALLICAALCLPMLFLSASAFESIEENFDTLPASLNGVEGVALQSNGYLKISLPGQSNTEAKATTWGWGWKANIPLSSTLITTDTTVTLSMRTDYVRNGWYWEAPFVLADDIGKATEGQMMGGISFSYGFSNDGEKCKNIKYISTEDGNQGTRIYTDYEPTENSWVRVDLLVDFTNKKTEVYVAGQKQGTANWSAEAVGFKCFKMYTNSIGNLDQEYDLDEVVLRNGLIAPTSDDSYAQGRSAIEADPTVFNYISFDAMPENCLTNNNGVGWTIANDSSFSQSMLNMRIPKGEDAFEAYMSLSESSITGNATVSFKVQNTYTVNKLPGLKIKLTDAQKNVLGGIVIGENATLKIDDGTHVYAPFNGEKQPTTLFTGKWFKITLLVNYTNHSLTVYVNDTRIGTVALESSTMTGFTGVTFSKLATNGLKPLDVALDEFLVVDGLFTPGSMTALSDTDALVTIDTAFEEATEAQTEAQTNKPGASTEKATTAGTGEPAATGEAKTEKTEEKKSGCGSTVASVGVLLSVFTIGLGCTVRSKKH